MTEGNVGVEPSFLARVSWSSLLRQFSATLACVTALVWLITLIPEETAGYLLIGIVLLLGVPVALALALVPAFLALWRPRIFVMIILSVMLLAIAQLALMGIEAKEMNALDQRQLLPAQGKHDLVLTGWLSPDCAALCMEVLAKSDYRHFAQRKGNEWTVWELRHGPSCVAPDTRESYIDFLSAGFTGMCAVRSSRPAGQDALSIEFGHAGQTFKGSDYELVELRNGDRKLLSRWISGSVYPLSYWFQAVGLRAREVGTPFQDHEFYASALRAPIVGGEYPGGAPLDAVFDGLASLPPDPKLQWKVLAAYRALAELNRESSHDFLVTQVTRLLDSGRPNDIVAGFSLLQRLPPADVSLAQPRIVALLTDRDPDVVAAALGAVFRFSMEDRRALQSTFITLAESPALAPPVSPALEPLLGHFKRIGVFPAADRERAKALLMTRDDLSGPQRVALLSIIAYGGPAMRAEAGGIVLTMKDQALFDLVVAMKDVNWPDLSGQQHDNWTDDEMRRLVEHLDRVPPIQFVPYVTKLRVRGILSKYPSNVVPVLRQRLAEAQAEMPRDAQRIRDLESLKFALDR